MSVESTRVVLKAQLDPTSKLILIGIADHDGPGGSWPSLATLAEYACCSVSTVKRRLRLLEEQGLIVRHVQAGGTARTPRNRRTNRYELSLDSRGVSSDPPEGVSDTLGGHPDDPSRGVTQVTSETSLETYGATDVAPSGDTARSIAIGFHDHWTASEGRRPRSWSVPQMLKLIEPFLDEWTGSEMKRALEAMRISGATFTRQTIEQHLRGVRRRSALQERQSEFDTGIARYKRQSDSRQLRPAHRPEGTRS